MREPSPLQLDRPPRIALLTNPGSGRNRKGLTKVRELAAANPRLACREASGPKEIAAALRELSQFEPDLLTVNGGDGTVQAVLTSLFRDQPFAKTPVLALVRGGTTNMTAGDIGLKYRMPKALRKIVALAGSVPAPLPLLTRPILRVEMAPGGDTRYGMFFGAGAIVRGIEYCHAKVHSKGFRDGLAPGICTLRVLLAMARKDSRYVQPVPMGISTETADCPEGEPLENQEYYLVLASPLRRLFLGLRPYWGPDQGTFHFSALRSDPVRALRTLPPLFWGRPGPLATPANGYYSQSVDALRLHMDGPLTLDGEIYHASREQGPVRVSVGGWISFLQI